MSTITEELRKYHDGDEKAMEEILLQMMPLIKKYARKIHFMEQEDALQELSLAMIKTIRNADTDRTEAENLRYFEISISGCYKKLCTRFQSQPKELPIDCIPENYVEISEDAIDLAVSLQRYIAQVRENDATKAKILIYALNMYSDIEISRILGLSRQYVHRIKRKLFGAFFEER